MKPLMPLLTFILLTGSVALVHGQAKGTDKQADKNFPNTLQPVNPVKYYGPRKEKKAKKTVTYDAKDEYNERMERNWREREKRERSNERGEAVDKMRPPYFGHKKPPKIRAIGKRKYCKICGIRH